MSRYTIELFGLPAKPTDLDLRKVEVELNNGASLRDVVAALRRKMPALEGSVFVAGEDRLREFYAFNVNGNFHDDDSDIRLKDSDHIILLLLATGG